MKRKILEATEADLFKNGRATKEDGKIVRELGITELVIPEGVTEIEDAAFLGCKSLQMVTIPNNVTIIDGGAFAYCRNLTNVTIGKNVENIGVEVYSYGTRDIVPIFEGCRNLKKVIFMNKTLEEIQSMDNYPWGIANPEQVIVPGIKSSSNDSLSESLIKRWTKRYLQSI